MNLGSERKIDVIDRRLNDVVRMLQDLKTERQTSTGPEPANHTPPFTRAQSSTPAGHAVKTEADDPVIEGDASITEQGVFANEFLNKVVNTELLQDASLELRETLDSLRHIMSTMKQQSSSGSTTYSNAAPVPGPSKPAGEMPPIDKVVSMVREAGGTYPSPIYTYIKQALYHHLPPYHSRPANIFVKRTSSRAPSGSRPTSRSSVSRSFVSVFTLLSSTRIRTT